MNAWLTLPVRYLLGRKQRTVLTTLAVVFGVMVIFAVNISLPTLTAALQGGVLGLAGEADLTVSSALGETFAPATVDAARAESGVTAASPSLRRQVSLGAGAGALSVEVIGVDPATAEAVRRYPVAAGRFLTVSDTQVAVLSQSLAQALGVNVGGSVQIPTPQGLTTLPVVGVIARQGVQQVITPLGTAQALFAASDRINTIDLALGPGAGHDQVKGALQARLGPGYRVGSVASESDAFANLQISLVAVNLFGILTLFMAGFLIFNTFRAIVVERRHDIGMLRAVGATRGAIIGLILAESTLQGVVGTAIGLVLGYGLAQALASVISSLLDQFMRVRVSGLVVTPGVLALSIGLGIGVTLLAGLLPAWSASRVPVLAALRPQPAVDQGRAIGRGAIFGGILLALAVGCLATGNASAAGLGAVLFLAGLVALAPALVGPLARALTPLLSRIFPGEGALAAENMPRQPGRAAVTASALMIALAIIVALTSVLASLTTTFYGFLEKSLSADIVLLPPSIGLWGANAGAGPEFERKLAAIPGMGPSTGLRYAGAQANGVAVQIMAIDPPAYQRLSGLTFDSSEGDPYAALAAGRATIVTPIFASAQHLRVGDNVTVQTPEGPRAYRLVGIGADYLTAKINTLFISQQNLAADFHKTEDVLFLANLAPGADPAAVRSRVEALLRDYPQFALYWSADWRASQRVIFDQVFIGLYAVLIVLIIPSLLGLINTLAINVLERTREIGVLRAIGATRRQVRRLVLAEALLLGAVGAVLGMVAGIALGYALTVLMASALTSQLQFAFPLSGLAIALVASLIIAILASLLPARQAARLQIVRALQYE
jgi:putative ABC transport system permease protein